MSVLQFTLGKKKKKITLRAKDSVRALKRKVRKLTKIAEGHNYIGHNYIGDFWRLSGHADGEHRLLDRIRG